MLILKMRRRARVELFVLQAFSKLDAAASLNGGEDMEEDSGVRALTQLFSSLPQLNQNVILYLLDHLVR